MPFKGKDAFVLLVFWLPIYHSIRVAVPIIKTTFLARWCDHHEFFIWYHLTDVPYFQKLIFTITCYIYAITFTTNICYAFCVTDKYSDWNVAWYCTSIPNLDHGVIWTWKEYVGMLPVGKTNWVDLVTMCTRDSRINFVLHKVITYNLTALWPTDYFFTITWKFAWENSTTSSLALENLIFGPSSP